MTYLSEDNMPSYLKSKEIFFSVKLILFFLALLKTTFTYSSFNSDNINISLSVV